MEGAGLQAGIRDPRHPLVPGQEFRDGVRIGNVPLHAQRQRLDPVQVRNAFIGASVGPKSRSATARALVVKAKSPKFS